MEKKWRSLARSYQVSEQLTDFTKETKRKGSAPITPFLRGQAFESETIENMGKAFMRACDTLGLSECDDDLSQLVAQKIIELAQRGLKNPTALHLTALQELNPIRNSAAFIAWRASAFLWRIGKARWFAQRASSSSLTNSASGDDTSGGDDSNGGANGTGSSDGANGTDNNGDDTSMLVTYQKIRLK